MTRFAKRLAEARLTDAEINDIARTWDGGYAWDPKEVANAARDGVRG